MKVHHPGDIDFGSMERLNIKCYDGIGRPPICGLTLFYLFRILFENIRENELESEPRELGTKSQIWDSTTACRNADKMKNSFFNGREME